MSYREHNGANASVDGNAVFTVIAAPDTWVLVEIFETFILERWSADNDSIDAPVVGGTALHELSYAMTIETDTTDGDGGAGAGEFAVEVALKVDGNFLDGSHQQITIDTSTQKFWPVSGVALAAIADSDAVEVWIRDLGETDNILVRNLSLTAVRI